MIYDYEKRLIDIDGLKYAVSAVPNVSLFLYEVKFQLKAPADIRKKK